MVLRFVDDDDDVLIKEDRNRGFKMRNPESNVRVYKGNFSYLTVLGTPSKPLSKVLIFFMSTKLGR